MVDHPFVSNLKTGAAVAGTNVSNQVSRIENFFILLLPRGVPATFKTGKWTSAYQLNRSAFLAQLQHNLRCPNVYSLRHTLMNTVKPSLTAFFISLSRSIFISQAGLFRPLGRWPVKQHRCCRSSNSVAMRLLHFEKRLIAWSRYQARNIRLEQPPVLKESSSTRCR